MHLEKKLIILSSNQVFSVSKLRQAWIIRTREKTAAFKHEF